MSDPFSDGIAAEIVALEALTDLASAPYGLTENGFLPKPYARLVAEGMALARQIFGPALDLEKGSVIRKLLELSALEDARTWAALGRVYDNSFVTTAAATALTALGAELGLPRPFLEAEGRITLALVAALPAGSAELVLPEGARMLSEGGHHAALAERVRLSATAKTATVKVRAFWPGPEHNLDPAQPGQKLTRWNPMDLDAADGKLAQLGQIARALGVAPEAVVSIQQGADQKLTGGDLTWDDERYRRLLLGAPRSLWTQDAIRTAVSLVPGVRSVLVKDLYGGLDIERALFGNMTFLERVFAPQRDLGSTFGFTLIVAPTASAIWGGADGLEANIREVVEDLRPIGVAPDIIRANEVGIGVSAEIVVRGLPFAAGTPATVDGSAAAMALKSRLLIRLGRYIETLDFGDPVRPAQIIAAFLREPGVEDLRNLRLLRSPASDPSEGRPDQTEVLAMGDNLILRADEIAVAIDDPRYLRIV